MSNRYVIKRVLTYIGKYKLFLFASMFFALISTVMMLYVPILIGNAIDCLVGKGNVDLIRVRELLVIVLVFVAIIVVLNWLMNIFNNKLTNSVIRDMRALAFDKLQILPFSYLDKHLHGDIVSRVTADVEQLADGLLMGLANFFTGIVTIIGTLAFMLSIDAFITIIVVTITPLSFLIASFIARRTYKMFKLQSEVRGEQTGFINEMITNQKVAAAYGMNDENMERFDELNERFAKYSLKAVFYSSLTNPATRFVNGIVYMCVALFGAIMVVKTDNITIGILASFLAYANQYTKPFNEISAVVTELQNAIACAGRIIRFIEEDPEKPDEPDALTLNAPKGDVEFKNVSFSYEPNKTLIEDMNLHIEKGMRVAIVGPTGCGKTTLINLLMRFYDPQNGVISVDGINNTDIRRDSLHRAFGMVLQETWLKNTTVLENIKLGNPNATKEEVMGAAKGAYAHSFIRKLPDGYDTVIGESGGNLSVGQKQLICIARLMLCDPPMLILDEATSSIDTLTEIKIQKAFAKLMDGRTTFIVAHRLSTIKEADLILVMNGGKIIEQGNHKTLLKQNGFYSELYNSQFPQNVVDV